MTLRTIAQKQFLKGVNASVAYNSQPKGTLPRTSNLVYSSRGALRSCDQNVGICTLNGTGPVSDEGPFLSVQFFQPSTTLRKVLAFQKDVDTQLAVPTGLSLADGGTGGSLAADTYYYVITALDGAGGETKVSAESHITIAAGHIINVSWTAVPHAYAYNVYRGTASSAEVLLSGMPVTAVTFSDTGIAAATSIHTLLASPSGANQSYISSPGGGATNTYTFTTTAPIPNTTGQLNAGSGVTVAGCSPAAFNKTYAAFTGVGTRGSFISVSGNSIVYQAYVASGGSGANQSGGGGTITVPIIPPTVNTTQTLAFLDVSGLSFTKPGSIIATFPTGPYQPVPSFPQGIVGGSSSGIAGGGNIASPAAGGIVGLSCPIPDLVSFAGKMILVLGNGLSPYQSDGTSGGTTALTNSFTAAFPAWLATTAYSVGDVIEPTTPNGYTYICTQAGISGTTEPAPWPTATGATVSDHQVIWKQNGSDATPAPRGAAHAISYAGSLWLWNTYPSNTSDNLDGPSILKMSDANNANSWNPLNVAYVGKDDGQQGMGIATFTIAESGIAPTGSLVLFKEFSTYQVLGVFGSTDFTIQKAQTNLGCIAPRTIQFVPGFGIVRLSHLGVAVFDGVRDRLISEEIRPYLFVEVPTIAGMDFSWAYTAKADIVADPPMYVLAIPVIGQGGQGQLTRLCCYDLVLKAWTIIDIPFSIGAIRQLNIPGGQPLTVFGGWDDAMVSRWQADDQQGWQAWLDPSLTLHQGTPMTWSFRTPAALGAENSDRVMFRRLLARGIWRGYATSDPTQPMLASNSTGTSSFTVFVTIDNESLVTAPARELLTPDGDVLDNSFQLVCEIGRTGLDAYATISGTQALSGAPVEIDEIDWIAIPRPVGSLVRV